MTIKAFVAAAETDIASLVKAGTAFTKTAFMAKAMAAMEVAVAQAALLQVSDPDKKAWVMAQAGVIFDSLWPFIVSPPAPGWFALPWHMWATSETTKARADFIAYADALIEYIYAKTAAALQAVGATIPPAGGQAVAAAQGAPAQVVGAPAK